MSKYLLIFSVRARFIRDHSVERVIECKSEELSTKINTEKRDIEQSIMLEDFDHWSRRGSGDDEFPWQTVVLTQALPISKD